jgi:thiol-disulfide isomerase/thioredoxin
MASVRMNAFCLLAVLCLPVVPCIAEAAGSQTSPSMHAAVEVGQPFPPLEFHTADGKTVNIASMKGKVVLVDFWATWCGPCVRETPRLKALYSEFHAKGLEIVGISHDKDRQEFDKYVAEQQIPWPQYFGGTNNVIAKRFQVYAIPTGVLIDAAGIVRANDLRGSRLDPAVRAIFTDTGNDPAGPVSPFEASPQHVVRRSGGNFMEVVAIEPNLPRVLTAGERLTVKVRYTASGNRAVNIAASAVGGVKSQGAVTSVKAGQPEDMVDCWFTLPSGGSVSSFRVTMTDATSHQVILTLTCPFHAEWKKPSK